MRSSRMWMALAVAACDRDPEPSAPAEESGTVLPETGVPEAVDTDGDGAPDELDCAPDDPAVYPGAPDRCGDERVTDCDRNSDDRLVTVDGAVSFTDLQEALDAASEGAEVLVCPGNYLGPFVARVPVDLVSFGGSGVTDLDGRHSGSTLSVPGGSSVAGFTIHDGRGPAGGGILQTSMGLLTVIDSVVHHNQAGSGGGVSVAPDGIARFVGTSIEDNTAEADGGGIAVGPNTILELGASVVTRNRAGYGGGVHLEDATLLGGRILDNISTAQDYDRGGGGGVLATGVSEISGTELAGNRAVYGGGFATSEGLLVLTDVSVHDNGAATGIGGGAFVQRADLVFLGASDLVGNTASWAGGLHVCRGTVTGGAVTGNTGTADAGGIWAARRSVLTDVVVTGNQAPGFGGVHLENSTMVGGSIVANQAQIGGGGGATGGGGTFDGVLVTDNIALEQGGGLYAYAPVVVLGGSSILRNTAASGGGAWVADPQGELVSVDADWGEGLDDNVPDDVRIWTGWQELAYGPDASFECGWVEGCALVP